MLDRYLDEDVVLPGGGALNIAYHWSAASVPFRIVSRIGDDAPGMFGDFLARLGIQSGEVSLVVPGRTASIDIVIRADRQPWMDNYVEGVWSDLRLNTTEEKAITGAARVHAILVEPVIRELHRLGDMGILSGAETSADFMDFRHYDAKRFESTMRHVDIGFVGWPGSADDPLVSAIRQVAFELGKLVVLTRGAECIMAFDGPAGREFSVPVTAVPVLGTTVGCGDAFIAAFLAARIRGAGTLAAIEEAKPAGAAATAWMRPLPDAAYGVSGLWNQS